LKRKTGNTVRL